MTPIVNPRIFYLMSFTDKLIIWSVILCIVLSSGVGLYLFIKYMDGEDEEINWKTVKKVFLTIAVCLSLSIFTPSSETLLKMVVAQNVTYERAEIVGDVVQDVYEDILSMFDNEEDEED